MDLRQTERAGLFASVNECCCVDDDPNNSRSAKSAGIFLKGKFTRRKTQNTRATNCAGILQKGRTSTMNRSELASAQTLPLSPYRGQEPGGAAGYIHSSSILGALRRRWGTVMVVGTLLLAVAAAGIFQLPKRYVADGQVMLPAGPRIRCP